MDVELTPDQRDFVRKAIESGRISGEEEAVQQALALWEERERRRLETSPCLTTLMHRSLVAREFQSLRNL